MSEAKGEQTAANEVNIGDLFSTPNDEILFIEKLRRSNSGYGFGYRYTVFTIDGSRRELEIVNPHGKARKTAAERAAFKVVNEKFQDKVAEIRNNGGSENEAENTDGFGVPYMDVFAVNDTKVDYYQGARESNGSLFGLVLHAGSTTVSVWAAEKMNLDAHLLFLQASGREPKISTISRNAELSARAVLANVETTTPRSEVEAIAYGRRVEAAQATMDRLAVIPLEVTMLPRVGAQARAGLVAGMRAEASRPPAARS